MLSSSTEKYFAVASEAGGDKCEIMRMRSGLAITRQTNEGLQQSLDGATYFRASPLVFVIKGTFTSGNTWKFEDIWRASTNYGFVNVSYSSYLCSVNVKGLGSNVSNAMIDMQYVTTSNQRFLNYYSHGLTQAQFRIVNHDGTLRHADIGDTIFIRGYLFK